MIAKEVLNKMEFGSWDDFRNYVTSKLEERFGVRSSISSIVKIDGIKNQLNFYAKEQLLLFLMVHKKNLSTLPSPNKSAITAANIMLEGDILQVKEHLSSHNIYANLANMFDKLSDAYNRYALLESLSRLEEDQNNQK